MKRDGREGERWRERVARKHVAAISEATLEDIVEREIRRRERKGRERGEVKVCRGGRYPNRRGSRGGKKEERKFLEGHWMTGGREEKEDIYIVIRIKRRGRKETKARIKRSGKAEILRLPRNGGRFHGLGQDI